MKKKEFMKKIYLILFIISIFTSSCKTAEKQFRQGDYEEAINISVKKLQRNPDKEEYVLLLEEAFKRANNYDLSQITQLNYEGQPSRWEDIYYIYQGISRRQHKIEPLLPLMIDSEDRVANFELVDIVKEITNAKKNAVNFWYADANQKLSTENKYDARAAYAQLINIESLQKNYKDVKQLMQQAKNLGINEVEFIIENNSKTILPANLDEEIRRIEPGNISGIWYELGDINHNSKYDMTVVLNITKIESFPEKIGTTYRDESIEVKDGFTYLFDDAGNVLKDSLGNPIKIDKYETRVAHVAETFQEKIATIEAEVIYIENASGKKLASFPIKSDGIFQNYALNATGYYDALSPETRSKLGGKVLPFPTDEDILLQAVQTLERLMQNVFEDNNDDILNN